MAVTARWHRGAALVWGALATFFLAQLLAWPLSRLLDGTGVERPLRRFVLALPTAMDEVHGLFALAMLEVLLMILAMLLGFGAVLAFPLLMLGVSVAFARAHLRARAWAEAGTMVVLAILALGSVVTALRPAATFGEDVFGRSLAPTLVVRALDLALAAAAGFALWAMRARAPSAP